MSDYDNRMRAVLESLRLRRPTEIDEGKAREALRRGAKAKQLLADEDLKQAFDMIEAVYLGAWRMSDATEVDKRERCHIAVSLLADIRGFLKACVENGDAARAELERHVTKL